MLADLPLMLVIRNLYLSYKQPSLCVGSLSRCLGYECLGLIIAIKIYVFKTYRSFSKHRWENSFIGI
ncbi:MAG: hypothetical protein DJ555_06145 [Desulfurococcaceae archaeon]|nr:MAG: hypothetical protein DJ555_06145 [Desulfurococcaceae archaeon]